MLGHFFSIVLVGTTTLNVWPRGLMDKASDFESEDCELESRRGQTNILKIIGLNISGNKLKSRHMSIDLAITVI